MEDKKTLQINCAVCDVRGATEETLDIYKKVEINAASVITSPAAQELLGRHEVQVNCASSVSLDGSVRFAVVNGPLTIHAGQAVPEERSYLVVNAPLTIEPGTEEILKSYAGMTINGPVNCPESLAGLLTGFLVNGPVRTYPDGGILLKKVAVLDRVFHLRAKQDACYCVPRKLIALAPDIAFDKLAEKNVRFVTKELLVSESHAEAAVALVDERADVTILPDGCAYVDDDAQLDETLLKRYGGKLYVAGDLTIGSDAAGALEQVSFLRLDGDLRVARSLKDRVLEMDAEYGELYTVGGTVLSSRGSHNISARMLEDAEDGLSAVGCANVSIDADVTPELLREKLVSILDCASVSCATREQMDAVALLAHGVASVSLSGQAEDDGEEGQDEDAVEINAAFYTL